MRYDERDHDKIEIITACFNWLRNKRLVNRTDREEARPMVMISKSMRP